jgi:hypothetical protein
VLETWLPIDQVASALATCLDRAGAIEQDQRMHPVEVVVTSAETKEDGVAEFVADGRTFAFTILKEEELVVQFVPRDDGLPTVVGARSLMQALEHARTLLS